MLKNDLSLFTTQREVLQNWDTMTGEEDLEFEGTESFKTSDWTAAHKRPGENPPLVRRACAASPHVLDSHRASSTTVERSRVLELRNLRSPPVRVVFRGPRELYGSVVVWVGGGVGVGGREGAGGRWGEGFRN
jgi:hypothetical protein